MEQGNTGGRATAADWRVAKDNRRALPCHETIPVRVKIVEPGVQNRWCELCRVYRYFVLEPHSRFDGILKLRWMTDGEVEEYQAQFTG